jgi:hypothetical protein
LIHLAVAQLAHQAQALVVALVDQRVDGALAGAQEGVLKGGAQQLPRQRVRRLKRDVHEAAVGLPAVAAHGRGDAAVVAHRADAAQVAAPRQARARVQPLPHDRRLPGLVGDQAHQLPPPVRPPSLYTGCAGVSAA